MSYDTNASFSAEQAKISGSFPIDMYVINASLSGKDYRYYWNGNQDVYGFQLNATGDLSAAQIIYEGLPIERSDIESNTNSEVPEITLSVPNTDRVIESVIQENDYLRGADIHFISTFKKFLPSGATATYVGSVPDHTTSVKEKMFVDGVSSNESAVTFSCKPKFVIRNVILPGRRFERLCQHKNYLGTECDPLGSINSASYTTCDFTTVNCRERQNLERFGGFPSIPRKSILIV